MPLQADLFNLGSETPEKISLPKEYFGVEINKQLIAQSVHIFLSNQRKAHAHAKTRGEGSRTTKKAYKQKGTGRARHGDMNAPIFVGGGKAHGPTGTQNYKKSLTQKMKNMVIRCALSSKYSKGEVLVVDGFDKLTGKTKEMATYLKNLKIKGDQGKYLLVTSGKNPKLTQAIKNIKELRSIQANSLSAYTILNSGTILFMKSALEELK